MKGSIGLYLTCLILVSITFTGCNTVSHTLNNPSITPAPPADSTSNNVETIRETPRDNVINIFSQTDELPRLIERYQELHPDFPYKIQMFNFSTADMDFHAVLDQYLAGGEDIPDIYCVESYHVPKYSRGDSSKYATPYKELGIDLDNLINEADIAQYVIDMGTNQEGEIVSLAYMGSGGAFIYRRSIAMSVWGTDKPDIIKDKIGPGWDKFFEAVAELKAKGYGIVSGVGDIWHSIENSAQKPWVVDGKLYIDPKREAFLDYAKELIDKGYSNNTYNWRDEWFYDMKGSGEKEILGFFGPSWLVNYILEPYSGGEVIGEGTYGDWAICQPPVGFFWGGSWVFVHRDSHYKEYIGNLIKWITLDSSESGLQYYWANSGDDGVLRAVASGTVMKNSEGTLEFLGHQDMFEEFYLAAKLANGKNRTHYDETINSYWLEQVNEYTVGNKTREQAIKDFKQMVKKLDIVVD